MSDTLVIYYSFSGNSKKVVEYVRNKLNADILELEPAISFSNDYDINKIRNCIQKENKVKFPYLSGNKICNY